MLFQEKNTFYYYLKDMQAGSKNQKNGWSDFREFIVDITKFNIAGSCYYTLQRYYGEAL